MRMVKCELIRLRRETNRDSLERSNPLQSGRSQSSPPTALSVVQKGDCHSWIKHGSCSRGNDCAFQHDPQKKGAGKGKKKNKGKGIGNKGRGGQQQQQQQRQRSTSNQPPPRQEPGSPGPKGKGKMGKK